MRAAVVLTGLTLLLLTFGAPAQATPSVSPSCGPVPAEKIQTGCHNPCTVTEKDADLVHRLPCFEVKFTDKCDGTTVVTLGNTAPYTLAVYVVGAETYNIKGGTSKLVTVTPHRGYVLVTAKYHEPWNHKYVKPRCPSPSASPTPTKSAPAVVPAGNGQPSLPVTGPVTAFIGVAGAALVAIGVAGIVVARRRKTRFTA
jgi:hypothetical protein